MTTTPNIPAALTQQPTGVMSNRKSPSARWRSIGVRLVISLAIVAALYGSGRLTLRWMRSGTAGRLVMWTVDSDKPVPDRFKYAMFPRPEGTPILDQPDGASLAALDRAMLNEQRELGLDFIPIQDGGQEGVVARSSLIWRVSDERAVALVDALVAERRSRPASSDDRRFSCRVRLPETADGEVELSVGGDDYREWYTYRIAGDRPIPTRFERATPMSSIGDAWRLVVGLPALLAELVVALIGIVLAWSLRR